MTKRSIKAILLTICIVCISVFAHETDSLFVPPKPEKPLRYCSSVKKWIEFATNDSNMVEITRLKGVRMDLRYATFENVTGHDLYCGVQRAFVHKDAAAKLRKAVKMMEREMPGSELVIFDASRPLYAQEALRKTVRGTPYSAYVSSPATGGLHNFGLALDLSITDADGNLLDMGTDFDSFERCAGEVGERPQVRNRLQRNRDAIPRLRLHHEAQVHHAVPFGDVAAGRLGREPFGRNAQHGRRKGDEIRHHGKSFSSPPKK